MDSENKIVDLDSAVISRAAAKTLIEKKGIDVRMFYLGEKSSVTDYYVNATGRSSMQVSALADYVVELIGEMGMKPLRVEGRSGNAWILVDYGDVIVNVFDKQSRDFYSFDRHLPSDSEMDISDIVAEVDKKYDINKSEE